MSSKIQITLPDGSIKTFDAPVTPQTVALSISPRLEKDSLAAKIDGKPWDLTRVIPQDSKIELITRQSEAGLEILRHSTAHLLAHAIKELFPKAQITIGPVIEDGFFYDIDAPEPLTPEDLPRIEKKMEEIAARKIEVSRDVWAQDKAVSFFLDQGEKFKAEIIRDLGEAEVSVYTQDNFTDLCRGPHVPNTSRLGKFKLLSIAGAYWRGNENNPMLQRIYGTAWATKKDLDEYLNRLEEARKRDHRKLGPELGLFTFLPVAPAMPFYLPKGTDLYNRLTDFMRAETSAMGYQEVICPQLMTSDLWRTSGHLGHYDQNMFQVPDGDDSLCLKPMNCPGHAALFKSTLHSYRELPIRFTEYSKLHRNERTGVTHGIFRTRSFSQDDGHIFCTVDQVQQESIAFIQHTLKVYRLFGFHEVGIKLATRPESYVGSVENWDKATKALAEALDQAGLAFEWAEGEGAFYGPKIEFHIRDSLKRDWQCGTIQADFNLPERFDLEYIDSNNQAQRPVMLHRAIFGSLERFLGILVEHTAGHFPLWLAPVQVRMLNLTDAQADYAVELEREVRQWGVRVESDLRGEKLGKKIREAQLQKVPFMGIIGPKEAETKTISIRKRNGENLDGLSLGALQEFLVPQLKPDQEG